MNNERWLSTKLQAGADCHTELVEGHVEAKAGQCKAMEICTAKGEAFDRLRHLIKEGIKSKMVMYYLQLASCDSRL